LLVGAGAQAKYALETFAHHEDVEIVGLVDIMDNQDIWGQQRYGSRVLGGLDVVDSLAQEGLDKALVCCASPHRKAELIPSVREAGYRLVSAIHPRATVATTARVGDGVIINAGAIIQPFARIGDGVMIHANVVVEHDNVIEDYVNLAPAVSLAGWVTVKERATVYTGAVAIPQVTIGRGAVVGAGAVMLEDVPDGAVAVGVPARVIRTKGEG
jgi:sugar O-acyltransferase (sialic acid O-acetyltransferase NeuD family)